MPNLSSDNHTHLKNDTFLEENQLRKKLVEQQHILNCRRHIQWLLLKFQKKMLFDALGLVDKKASYL